MPLATMACPGGGKLQLKSQLKQRTSANSEVIYSLRVGVLHTGAATNRHQDAPSLQREVRT
jgi:hypothetical protein